MLLGVVAEGLDPVLVVVDLLEQARVRDRKVIALEVVVDVHLPVASDVVVAALDQPHPAEVITRGGDLRRYGADPISQRRRIRIEVRKDERPKGIHANRDETEVRLVEILGALHLARGLEAPVQSIDPAVVSALKGFAVAARRHHLRRAVPADVVEAAQLSVLSVGQENRLVEDVRGLEVTDAGELARMRHELPAGGEDPIRLAREDGRVEVSL